MCIFIGCWPWSIKGHIQMTSNPRQITSAHLFFFQKSFNKPFQFFLYKTNRLHFPWVLYCNRSQKTSQRLKNNHGTRLCPVSYFLFFTRYDVICDLLQYTRTEKCNLFVKYNWNFLSFSFRVHSLPLYAKPRILFQEVLPVIPLMIFFELFFLTNGMFTP